MSIQEQKIIPMLELSVRNQQETSNALSMMLEAVKQMASAAEQASLTAQEARAEAQTAVTEVREIADEVRNSVWLFPAESNELHDAVRERSIELAKMNQVSEERFTETVGKIRRRIWSNLKKRYGVAKYIYIPHSQYTDAMDFVQNFSLVD
ncbi:hypothetical protein GCM10025857_15410 [Alicyclobacillus contaminans]|uniref:ORF6C domain-containing protein n=1 Tax=Alicyclobacillus contaminans TaxID=392016 RepID=UPI00041A3C1F|nr:ORF6C domain-containing protein [Alicyclobacillus contaminans]GMA50184.1 hypothetical protein GCM10025857_15410 [Alicyclobacillus contaminans]